MIAAVHLTLLTVVLVLIAVALVIWILKSIR